MALWLTQGLKSIESALERVDQQAASTLTQVSGGAASRESSSDQPRASTPPLGAVSYSAPTPTKQTPSSAKKDKDFNDDELLDFLNDPKPSAATASVSSIRSAPYSAPLFSKPTAPPLKPTPKTSSLQASGGDLHHPPAPDSSASRYLASPSVVQPEASPASPSLQHVRVEARDAESTSANVSISLLDTPDSSSSSPSFSSSSAAPAASSSLPQPPPSNTDNVVSLRNQRDEALMANRLLKTQMQELNGEVQELSQRAKTAHAAAERATEQLREMQAKLLEKEKSLVVLRRSEEALKGKLSELDSLVAKVSSLQTEIKGRDGIIADLQVKLEKSKNEARVESGAKDEEAQTQLEQERAHFAESRNGFLAREAQLLSAAEESAQEIARLQRKLDEQKEALSVATVHAKDHASEVKNLRQELTEYKSRASKVLQQREKTIEELTEKLSQGASPSASASLSQVVQLQQECDSLKQELSDARSSLEQTRQHLSEVQAAADAEVESVRAQLPAVEEKLEKERKRVQSLQVELLARAADVTALREAGEIEKKERERIQSELEQEVSGLRKLVAQKGSNGVSQDQRELESRMRTMTEHIINNQSVIDRLSSEKHSLQVQLESMQKQHITATTASLPARDDDLEARTEQGGARLRPISSLAPSLALREGFVARRVYRAANAIDGLSAGIGGFLRSSPTARLVLLMYLATLHLWVVYVMFTLTPEMHRPEDLEQHKP